MGMSNVCLVPLSFIFLRGQGIKVTSLVSKYCKNSGTKMPTLKDANDDLVVPSLRKLYHVTIVGPSTFTSFLDSLLVGFETLQITKDASRIYDDLEKLTNRLSQLSSDLLIKTLPKIGQTYGMNKEERLRKLNAIDQSEISGNPSYARQIKKEDYLMIKGSNSTGLNKIVGQLRSLV